jgi:hypothetical protein
MNGIAAGIAIAALTAFAGIESPAVAAPAAAASSAPSDSAQLRALHERVLEAHRKNDVEMILADDAEDPVVANRGEISRPTKEERRQRFAPYFASTRFEVYRDLVEPIVRVSDDGTLGWVICQVEVRGTQKDEAGKDAKLEFVSAWIELYEKRHGRWWRSGNVSNFKS